MLPDTIALYEYFVTATGMKIVTTDIVSETQSAPAFIFVLASNALVLVTDSCLPRSHFIGESVFTCSFFMSVVVRQMHEIQKDIFEQFFNSIFGGRQEVLRIVIVLTLNEFPSHFHFSSLVCLFRVFHSVTREINPLSFFVTAVCIVRCFF